MKYKTHNQDDLINSNMTHLVDVYTCNYDKIVAKLGEPLRWDDSNSDGKVQAEWLIEFDDGKVATLYDWKEYGTPVEMITEWHIGGHTDEVAVRIHKILGA